jgi:hypothetical protein
VAYFRLGPVKSAGGKSLWGNEAWLTLNKFSSRRWDRALALTEAPKPAPSLAGHLRRYPGPRGLRIELDVKGRAEAILRSLDGRHSASAAGEGSLELPTRGLPRGIYLLEIRHPQGGFRGPVTLGE